VSRRRFELSLKRFHSVGISSQDESSTGTAGLLEATQYGQRRFTVERPWFNNVPNLSCIPEGEYLFKLDSFKGKYENFRIIDPPRGRSDIEMHAGVHYRHSMGCILTGQSIHFDNTTGLFKLYESRRSIRDLVQLFKTHNGVHHQSARGRLVIR